ncbi:DUF4242 domain-containing protein [Mangrovivirga sp. M17]|uniref:DUF4242 domain-containing protein n=1 Tax=Mangrovivirga halotolerans TaxID=2993936 RepID=A0ABT3RLQ5_9BACT|nr:DUF4242 domain-containing protein [Mangrovivirga halotolerans]MCX2742739.1 DUF4242 domain-containing protein [Mangrovivirga halotolerans]
MKTIPLFCLCLMFWACNNQEKTSQEDQEVDKMEDTTEVSMEDADTRAMYIDVHDLGAGNVTAEAVAEAHEKDLAIQDSLDVNFVKYWVDEEQGKIYCLSKAHKESDIVDIHNSAHGLSPQKVHKVSEGIAADYTGDKTLYLDVHELGEDGVTAEDVAEAHEKDLAVQSDYDVNFINYWVDESSGTVMCLSEAPNAEAVRNVHKEAHGLVPVSVAAITEGE